MRGLRMGGVPPWIATALTLGAIFYLTLVPQPLGEEPIVAFEGADKVVHACMFSGLVIVFAYDCWRIGRPLAWGGLVGAALVSAILGWGIEWAQDVMGQGRTWDTADGIADTVGALLGAIGCGLTPLRRH